MTTATCHPATPVPLHRPWLRRVFADLAERWQRRAAPESVDYADLAHLSEQTLRDIGAPDWVHERDRAALMSQLDRVRW